MSSWVQTKKEASLPTQAELNQKNTDHTELIFCSESSRIKLEIRHGEACGRFDYNKSHRGRVADHNKHTIDNKSPALHFDEDVVKPLVSQPVGHVELKHDEGLENVLDAAHPSKQTKAGRSGG